MIAFPINEERIFYLGKQNYEQGDYLRALEYFNECYEDNPSLEINQFLVKTLMKIGQLEEAIRHIKEYEIDYKTQVNLQPLYFEVLLKEKQFLVLEKWLNQLDDSQELKKEFKQTLNKTQDYWTLVDSTEYIERLLEIKTMQTAAFITQKKLLKKAKYLTKIDFFKLSSEVFLVSEDISPLIRSQIVDELVQLGFEETVDVRDVFGQYHQINFSEVIQLIPTIKKNPLYQALSDYLENNHPSQGMAALTIIQTHLGMMYPHLNNIITDTERWFKAYLNYFGFEMNEEIEVIKIHNKIQLLDNTMMNTMAK